MLGKQQDFVNAIVRLVKEVSQFGGSRNKKVSLFIWQSFFVCLASRAKLKVTVSSYKIEIIYSYLLINITH